MLKLATMWEFQKIRATAIIKIGGMSLNLVDKLVIAQKFDISAWVKPTLAELARRKEMVSFSEANQLGMKWVLELAKLREAKLEANKCEQRRPRYQGI